MTRPASFTLNGKRFLFGRHVLAEPRDRSLILAACARFAESFDVPSWNGAICHPIISRMPPTDREPEIAGLAMHVQLFDRSCRQTSGAADESGSVNFGMRHDGTDVSCHFMIYRKREASPLPQPVLASTAWAG